MPDMTRLLRPSGALAVGAVLSIFHRGPRDPTMHRDRGAGWWLARRTPDGPGTLLVQERPSAGEVEATAWGQGGPWLLDALPDLLGEHDDDSGFTAHHPRVAEARRRHPGWRVPRSRLVLDSLIPAIIEQRVTGAEAFEGYRRLVRRFGEPAPGAGEGRQLMVAPDARGWAMIPSWEWLRAGVDAARADTAVRAARHAGRLEESVEMPVVAASRRLRAVPGIGVWTAAEVAQRALGDPDSPSFGDYHVAKNIGWALTGTPCDDAGLAELLEPYTGHRYRVQRLLDLDGAMRPRRGHRMALPTHVPLR